MIAMSILDSEEHVIIHFKATSIMVSWKIDVRLDVSQFQWNLWNSVDLTIRKHINPMTGSDIFVPDFHFKLCDSIQ